VVAPLAPVAPSFHRLEVWGFPFLLVYVGFSSQEFLGGLLWRFPRGPGVWAFLRAAAEVLWASPGHVQRTLPLLEVAALDPVSVAQRWAAGSAAATRSRSS